MQIRRFGNWSFCHLTVLTLEFLKLTLTSSGGEKLIGFSVYVKHVLSRPSYSKLIYIANSRILVGTLLKSRSLLNLNIQIYEFAKFSMPGSVSPLASSFLNYDWKLFFQLFVRVNDQRTYLQNELLICQNNIMRLQRNGSYWQ